jgi:hypothetical protein
MDMRIQDIVTQAQDATFAYDVKLDAYALPEQNLKLVRCYKFTYKVPRIPGFEQRNLVSSVILLNKLQRSVLDSEENRYVVMATYGHGKSHLALTLANFFGKPFDSPEVGILLDNIRFASDAVLAENFTNFKSSRPPFLVIRLCGDTGQGLSQQFLKGLETAITENDTTRGTPLPFWFDAAERFLAGLTGEQKERANAFLRTRNWDVDDLIRYIGGGPEGRRAEYHDLCIQVHQHLVGTRPDFGGEVSLQRAINWAVEEFCTGPDAKAGGVLVLFDEFSAFIEDYAQRKLAGGAGSLQDLLNGVSDQQGKALFVAFSQHDPDTVADDTFRYVGGAEQLQSLKKELTRLREKHNLYSSMETVLDGYLAQEDNEQKKRNWQDFSAQAHIALTNASDNARTLLYPRYEDNEGWGDGQFEEIVTKGCFPLHPLTTGLFCSLEFKNSNRRVLQFVLDELQRRQEEPALVNRLPNWVYPTALVDYFTNTLAAEHEYEQYEAAQRQPVALDDVEQAVLKAVLLFTIGAATKQIKLGRMRFDQAIAELCGHPRHGAMPR